MKILKLLALSAILFCSVSVYAQVENQPKVKKEIEYRPWYIGINGGVPLSHSTFTSYSKETSKIGLSGGLFVGYNFNSTLGLEIYAKAGMSHLGHHETCYYSLGPDGNRVPEVPGSVKYEDLYVSTEFRNLGLKFNIDLLNLFKHRPSRPVELKISPFAGVYNIIPTVHNVSDNSPFVEYGRTPTFGGGAELSFDWRITSLFSLGVYSSVAFLDKRIDGIQSPQHAGNFIHDTGLRLTFSFGGKKKTSKAVVVAPVAPAPAPAPKPVPVPVPVPVAEPEPEPVFVIETRLVAPLYFLQDSYVIRAEESQKLYDFLELLNADEKTKVELYGYCNDSGTEAYNDKLSQKRADNVKNWLINKGVSEDRFIKSEGMGIDKSDYIKGRRVELLGVFTVEQKAE